MSEFRQDPLTGRWIVFAPARAHRPQDFEPVTVRRASVHCPFCKGHESETPGTLLALDIHGRPSSDDWVVRVVPNKYPAVRTCERPGRQEGLHGELLADGAHEVVIESPDHAASLSALSARHLRRVVATYRDRFTALHQDGRFAYAVLFKNSGAAAGASLEHVHSQLMALPIVPLDITDVLRRTDSYFAEHARCLFCDLLARVLADGERLIAETPRFVAFCPFASRFPYEVWVQPRRHEPHFTGLAADEADEFADLVGEIIRRLECRLGQPAYNFIVQSAPFRAVPPDSFHWRWEIFPRLSHLAGFELGTGAYINIVPPEDAAERLRG